MKEIEIQVQEAQKFPNKINAKRPTPRHIIIKRPRVKNEKRLLEPAREKKLVSRWLIDGKIEGQNG